MTCSRFYCRECVIDHDGRLTCASCLQQAIGPQSAKSRQLAFVRTAVLAIIGLFVIWFSFYSLGRALLLLPTNLTEGLQ